ncbi:MAG: insulinase family protein [Deltaproteobacteria bacterium]|nr:insulinase family protein [Deltaproteobacteria bacterium]
MTDGISVVKLPGGLTAVLQENHDTPVVSALFFVRVGSADETDDQAGLAHLHEHMIFKGTPKRPVGRIAAEIEGAGGEINAYTTFDHTCYYVTMSSRYWTVGLDVLADALQNASLDAEELDRERHVILEEMSRSEDMPSNVVSRNLFKTMFRRHPYRRPIIGTRNVILGMQRCDVVAFFRRYYRPANVVAVVAGDFDPRDAEKRLRAAYAEAAPAAVRRPKRAAETAQRSARLALAFQPVQEATFELGYPAPHVLHPDTAVADIASLVLGGGDSARLVREVKRKRKLVYETFSYCYNLVDAGVFSAGGVCDPRRTVAAVRATAREVARLADRGLGQAELDKAKRIVESWFVYERETPSGLAKKLGYSYLFTGGLDYDERYLDRLAAVTRDDVRAYAADYLSPRRATLSLLAPPNFKNRLTKDAFREVLNGKSPARRAVRKSVSPAARAERPPTVAATAGQRHRLKMTRLSNGVRLIVKESTQTAIFSVKAVMHGGLRLEGRDHAGLSRLTTSLLTKGTKRHSADAFAEAVDGLAGGVSGFSGRNSVGVSGEFLSRDFEQGLELTAEALIDPTFPDEEIELARADTLAAIARREDQPDRRCIDLFLETLFTRHPYGVSMLGTPETLGRLSRRRLRAFHRAVVRPKGIGCRRCR